MAARNDIRNIGIVAHVDHGKTTLVDALLWQSGAFRAGQDVADRVLDSMDLEREKGITILAKNTAVHYGGVKLNIVDTPGHADFGGEVERGLTMVDGVLLLVDASEGPLPQTRFVLRKALEARLPVILVVNKVDRPDARIAEVVDEVYELFLDLDADETQIEFPIVYTNAKAGQASLDPSALEVPTSGRCSTCCSSTFPLLNTTRTSLQAHVTNLDAPRTSVGSRSVGCDTARSAGARRSRGAARTGIERVKVGQLYVTEALELVEADEAAAGEIIWVAGFPEIMIGETLADADDPRPLPVITVDEPSLSVTIGINTSPLAGHDGDKLTASQVKERLYPELVGNVSLRVLESDRPEVWEVQGRGELALSVLVELMRREGFELTVGNPQVVTRLLDGKLYEPIERMSDRRARGVRGRGHPAARAAQGTARADGQPRNRLGTDGVPGSRPWADRLPHRVPDRDARYRPCSPRVRPLGAVARRAAYPSDRVVGRRPARQVAAFALYNLQERGTLFVAPGDEVYEGMIVGESSRAEDLDVNATKEKHLTNMRSSTADELVRLVPKRELSLDQALEFLRATSPSRSPRMRCGCARPCSTGPPGASRRGRPGSRLPRARAGHPRARRLVDRARGAR